MPVSPFLRGTVMMRRIVTEGSSVDARFCLWQHSFCLWNIQEVDMTNTVVLDDTKQAVAPTGTENAGMVCLHCRGELTELQPDDRLVWDSKHNTVELTRRNGEPIVLVLSPKVKLTQWPADQTGDLFGLGKGDLLRLFERLAIKAGFRLRRLTSPAPIRPKRWKSKQEEEAERNAPVYVCFMFQNMGSSPAISSRR